ncbi:hypothetical protein WJU16_00855 [Chitinophaga pollutisoli]|uniref:Uncharacterized protein n=1 Tax=Chitinophaga pollutisoli TaxID=3133966 RepID=A0ABZ2YP77_9BACT
MPLHRLFAAICCLGVVTFARAQTIPDRVPYTMDSMVKNNRLAANIRQTLVDSLNHQARQLQFNSRFHLSGATGDSIADPAMNSRHSNSRVLKDSTNDFGARQAPDKTDTQAASVLRDSIASNVRQFSQFPTATTPWQFAKGLHQDSLPDVLTQKSQHVAHPPGVKKSLQLANGLRQDSFPDVLSQEFQRVAKLPSATAPRQLANGLRQDSIFEALAPDIRKTGKALVPGVVNNLASQNFQLPQGSFNGLQEPVRQQFMSYIQATSTPAKFNQLKTGFGALKDSARMERFLDDKLRGFYALLKDHPAAGQLKLPGKPENKLQKAGAQTSFGDTTGNASGWWSNVEVQDRFSLGAIPVNLQYANVSGHSRFGHALSGENLGNFKFDREVYLQKVSAHIRKHYDLKKYFLDDIDFKAQLKQFTGERLKALDTKSDSISKLIRPEELMYLDSIQLRNQLFANAGQQNLNQYKDSTLEHHLSKLIALQRELGGGLDRDAMLKSQHQLKSRMEKYMQDPASAAEMAPDLLPMSGLQRLFMKLKELNAGNIAANASKGTVSDLFMTGAAGSLMNKNKLLMIGAGKTRQALPYDIGLDDMQQAPSQSIQFLRMGKGDLDKPHHHVSMINASTRNDKRMPNARALMQNVFVGALSNRLSLGDWGDVDFELSKSNTSTGGGGTVGDHAAQSKAAIAHFFNDFATTLSTSLEYNSALPEYGLTQSVYFNYSGMGYNNPGNPYSRRGSTAYGLQVRRSWMKNKASVQVRTDFRNTSRSSLAGSQWKNRTLALDGRLRVSRQVTLSGRLHQSSMFADGDYGRQEQYLNRKASFSSQWNGRMGGLRFINQSSLGLQQMHYLTAGDPVKSLFLTAFVSHSIPVGEKLVTANVFYNRDIKDAAVYANLLTADAGYQYRLAKFLQCSSSLTFLDNKGVVRQAGIRQQVSASVLGRCQVNLSVDARKDLVNTPQNYLYGNFRSELSIFYMLNQ